MQILAHNDEVTTSGLTEVSSFQVKANAKLFETLFDKLYSNKVGAVVRELSCNAIDAHKAAGCSDKPFDLHLPTFVEPHFSIRDYGTGLSHEQVMNLYVTLFDSTKDTSNDYIGAYGLGSKTPFALVDQFTVTSYYHGTKSIYNAHRTPDRSAAIALLHNEPTSEPNGLQVEFAVNNRQIGDFSSEAANFYARVEVLPNFTGSDPKTDRITYSEKNSIYGVRKPIRNWNHQGIFIVVGQVAYPLKYDQIRESSFNSSLYSQNFDIFMPIGSVDISPSREELSYNQRTIDNIRAALRGIIKDITDKLVNDLDNCPTYYEAVKTYVKAIQLVPLLDSKQYTYKGRAVTKQITGQLTSGMKISEGQRSHTVGRRKTPTGVQFRTGPMSFSLSPNAILVEADVSKYLASHIFSWMKEIYNSNTSNGGHIIAHEPTYYFLQGDIAAFSKEFGDAPILKLSTEHPYTHNVAARTYNAGTKGPLPTLYEYHHRANKGREFQGMSATAIASVPLPIIYGVIKDNGFIGNRDDWDYLRDLGKPVYFLTERLAKKVAGNPSYIDLTTARIEAEDKITKQLAVNGQAHANYKWLTERAPFFLNPACASGSKDKLTKVLEKLPLFKMHKNVEVFDRVSVTLPKVSDAYVKEYNKLLMECPILGIIPRIDVFTHNINYDPIITILKEKYNV